MRLSARVAPRARVGARSISQLLHCNCDQRRRDCKLQYSQLCTLNLTSWPARSTSQAAQAAGLEAAVPRGPLCAGSPTACQALPGAQPHTRRVWAAKGALSQDPFSTQPEPPAAGISYL